MKRLSVLLISLFLLSGSSFAATLPEVKAHVNDCAGVMNAAQVSALEAKLTAYEQQTSNQVAVLTMAALNGAAIEDTSIKICEKWKGGLKGKDNGTLLLVVINDRKMRIEVGRGLEGALPDITCGHIIDEMKPFFRSKDYAGGINRGADSIMLAIKGEYKGTGKVVGQKDKGLGQENLKGCLIILGIILLFTSFLGALLCQIPAVGRFFSAALNGTVMYFAAGWLLSSGWAIAGAVIGGLVGMFAPEILEALASAGDSGGSGGSWSSGDSGGGGSWGGGGGSFSGGGASGSW
jgi:uncharacterized protein